MVNSFFNINKANNLLSSQAIAHKHTTTYVVGDRGSGLGQAQLGGGVKPINGTPMIIYYRHRLATCQKDHTLLQKSVTS